MTFFFMGVTKTQQFNINLLMSKAGLYVWSRTRHRPVGDLFGRTTRGIGIGFAGGLGVLVLTLIFQIKPGAIPLTLSKSSWRLLLLSRPCRSLAVWTTVSPAERMLRRHPKYITFLAPLVTGL